MPISRVYEPDQRIVKARCTGVVTVPEVEAYVRGVIEDRSIPPGFVEIFGMAEIEDFELTYRQLPPFRHLWMRYLSKGCLGTILHAPTNLSYGIGRMFQGVINAEEFEGGAPFLVLRSEAEVSREVDRLRACGLVDPWPRPEAFPRGTI